MAVPEITIGGVPIIEQNFIWSLRPGINPYVGSLILTKKQSETLAIVENPTVISVKVDAGFKASDSIAFEIKNVHLLEPKAIDPVHVQWDIADNRWSIKGQTITAYYNKTTIKNQFNAGPANPSGKPSEIRSDFDLFAVGRYIPWSVKEDGKPWSVKEILEMELRKTGLVVEDFETDNSYIVENIELVGMDVYAAISYLLDLSRLDIGINLDGSVYVYSIDYYDKEKLKFLMDKQKIRSNIPSRIFLQDRSRMRPKTVEIKFEAREELWLTYVSTEGLSDIGKVPIPIEPKEGVWDQDDIDNGKVIACENVFPVVYPTTYEGKEYKVGEWIPLHTFLGILGLDEATDVRANYFSNILQIKFYERLRAQNGGADLKKNQDFAASWLGSLTHNYRQTFRIDPYYMDRLSSWETRRCAVVDNFSHYSSPSPVFADFTLVPPLAIPRVAKRLTSWDSDMSVWEVNVQDPYRINTTLGTIRKINPSLGIFSIEYPPVSFSTVNAIYPFALTNPLSSQKGQFNNVVFNNPTLLSRCHVKDTYEMQTIISATLNVDPIAGLEGRRFYTVPCDFSPMNGKREYVEKFSRSEYARFAVRERSGSGQFVTQGDGSKYQFVNKGIVETIAKGEAARVMQQYNDFYEGSATLYGFVNKKLMANMQDITFSFTPKGGMNTTFTFRQTTPFTLEQKINQDAINFLHRHVSRGDTASDLTEMR